MRIFHIHSGGVQELAELPTQMPAQGFVWMACARPSFQTQLAEIQASLQALVGLQLVDLHVSDLLNAQLPSHYDYTSQYDLLVFRRLATLQSDAPDTTAATPLPTGAGATPPLKRSGPPVLRRIDTNPVGFAVFDQLLLTVHPADCAVRDAYAARLLASLPASPSEGRSSPVPGARVPTSPADLMLRVVNLMVDGYLDLRRELTRQLDHWQSELLKPRARYVNWTSLLEARLSLHMLDEICEDQRTAVQDWIDALETWELPDNPAGLRELDLLKVRSRDVLEHIERVVHHVRRLEQSTETAVQMHFSVQSNRTNDIMRTLTALTAVFLPLNLIAGIFGMNFEFLPLIHKADGFWWALGSMAFIALALVLLFWRKRYLARSSRM
ncbi:MAG: magnesium transporter CorA family protein [Gammaproteobacteria bacterium]|jgi:magnesium transporter|nr:magnesium transporter CorA family protein [Gammaproteobacteria bacterium]MBU1507957.1 magnesium transporter CorA family protein [Gammaproteobacteria bacterium]MBU2121455.1 magnesium transporter CorA family protein [Gammaproteobacteria bacterium]MBU2172316.1 magnesium transporter CorA family protein [Gammaproteobacteria bacterium]MBU2200342.1 magnesium transporter CorA family protein [Gammaproteobacteria bacterium]